MGNPDSQALGTPCTSGCLLQGQNNQGENIPLQLRLSGSLSLAPYRWSARWQSLGGGQLVSPAQPRLPPFQEMIQAFIASTPAMILCAHSHSVPETCPQGLSLLSPLALLRGPWGKQEDKTHASFTVKKLFTWYMIMEKPMTGRASLSPRAQVTPPTQRTGLERRHYFSHPRKKITEGLGAELQAPLVHDLCVKSTKG